MFKYIRTLNACSGIVETTSLPMPESEMLACEIGTICSMSNGRLARELSTNGAKYLVLSRPNKKGEQTCLRIMPGMILEASCYSETDNWKVGDNAFFNESPDGVVDTVDHGGTDCEILAINSSYNVTVIVN